MDTIAATEFKQRCLELLDSVSPEGLLIAKHGKPVARLLPAATQSADLIGSCADVMTIHGDIFSTGITWDAES